MRGAGNQGLPKQIWAPSLQQIEAALDLIQPAPKVRSHCKRAIGAALGKIEWAKLWRHSPAAIKRKFNNFVKKLRAIENSEIPLYAKKSMMDEIRNFREQCEQIADKQKIRHGSKQKSNAKRTAAEAAYHLLANFRKPPGLTRSGIWHKLAIVLYGDKAADLFDYMRESYRSQKF
jgi:hypothetical protein